MRIMYDAINPPLIPAGAEMVAGYVSGKWPSVYGYHDANGNYVPSIVELFPNAVHVSVATNVQANAMCLDIERFDATPQEAPAWVVRQRQFGNPYPWCYCSQSMWQEVIDAFAVQHVAQPLYWIANYDGVPNIPNGAIGKQYQNTAGWDISAMQDHIVGLDSVLPIPTPITVEVDKMATVYNNQDAQALRLLERNNGDIYILRDNASGHGAPVVDVETAVYTDLRTKAVNH